jgi:hypothetical protein
LEETRPRIERVRGMIAFREEREASDSIFPRFREALEDCARVRALWRRSAGWIPRARTLPGPRLSSDTLLQETTIESFPELRCGMPRDPSTSTSDAQPAHRVSAGRCGADSDLARLWPNSAQGSTDSGLSGASRPSTVLRGRATDIIRSAGARLCSPKDRYLVKDPGAGRVTSKDRVLDLDWNAVPSSAAGPWRRPATRQFRASWGLRMLSKCAAQVSFHEPHARLHDWLDGHGAAYIHRRGASAGRGAVSEQMKDIARGHVAFLFRKPGISSARNGTIFSSDDLHEGVSHSR